MLSIVPGLSNTGPLSSATEPKLSLRSGTYKNHNGRKLLKSAPTSQQMEKKDENVRLFPPNASIEEIDKMLEDDAFALLNIKKEINNSQQHELDKLRHSVLQVKKEYDTIHISNDILEKEVASFEVRISSLQEVDRASVLNNSTKQSTVDTLKDRIAEVLEEYAAEQRTVKMLTLMIKRYDEEIAQCRLDTAKATTIVEHAKHDLAVCENNVQNNRQELLEQEHQHEKLQQTVKLRQDQRQGKIDMLHSLSADGESSVARLQSSLTETARRTVQSANKARAKSSQSNKIGLARSTDQEEDVANEGSDLVLMAKRMTLPQAREVIQRYNSQTSRMEKLSQLDHDLRSNIAMQHRKKQELSDQLAQTAFKIQQLASSRQIYQEVDQKDSALARTSKQCDESKDKDFRLRLNIESLKQSIPRFLTKVTKQLHPKPTETQLGDAVLKLDDELTKLIKVIGSALLKDATPDDLAIMSQQSAAGGVNGEAHSEFARLQRLPGYSRMKRQLFFNLMTARPDVSTQNIRIEHTGKVKQPKSTLGNPPLLPGRRDGQGDTLSCDKSPRAKKLAGQVPPVTPSDQTTLPAEIFSEDASLDRTTIKNISKLIYERDHNKLKTAVKNS